MEMLSGTPVRGSLMPFNGSLGFVNANMNMSCILYFKLNISMVPVLVSKIIDILVGYCLYCFLESGTNSPRNVTTFSQQILISVHVLQSAMLKLFAMG